LVLKTRRLKFDRTAPGGAIRLLSDKVDATRLSEDNRTVVVQLARVMTFKDPFYGKVELTRKKFLQMIKNFKKGIYGQKIFIDVAHNPSDGAAAEINDLFMDGLKFRAEVEFTDFGIDAVKKRKFIYLSMDFTENYTDPETEKEHGPLLFGAGLTIRPRVKKQDPVQLSFEKDEIPMLLSLAVRKTLQEEIDSMFEEYLKKLRTQLSALKLSENIITQFADKFEATAKTFGDNAEAAEALVGVMVANARVLAENPAANESIKLDFSGLNISSSMSADDLNKILDEREEKRKNDQIHLDEKKQKNVDLFNRLLSESEGLKTLSEDQMKKLSSASDLITPEMTEDQITKLAEHQIALGNDLSVAAQLDGLGFSGTPAGSMRFSVDDSNKLKELQETVDRRLGLADASESRRFSATGGKLLEENKAFADKVLAEFDRENATQLYAEHKMLAGGDGVVSDVNVPVSWERTVIREALYQLVGLPLVNSGTVTFGSSYMIPYSYRDASAAGKNNTRRYEGQSINRAGVIQTAETAYNIPQKLSFEVSDELRYLTRAGHLNWDSVIENQQNASRIIAEDTEQVIFNEVLRAADEFLALAGSDDLGAQADGTNEIFVTTAFPVIRPRAVYDLQGNQVGTTSNPIVITLAGTPIEEYTGQTVAGTYYVMDYNLGEFYFVDEAATIQTPGAVALTITYSYSGNAYAFDTDLGTDATDVHWDKFLYRYGLRKSVIEDQRYHTANFGLMSGTAMTQVEQAKQFGANSKRAGTDLAMDGNLGRVKDIPNFKSTAPGLWMGDQRIIIGERGTTRLRMAKPWNLGELENQKDANGRFTGKKEAYGDQFIVCHTPTQLKRAYTSIILYSSSGRVARTA